MCRRGRPAYIDRERGALGVTPLRAIVVDDEPLARADLTAELRTLGVDVAAECADGFAAVDAILRERPDILLLDIAMPELDGFGVLERLEPEEVPPAVIFVTAYDAHALRAFGVHALDYLLKPVPTERLTEAITRAERRVAEAAAHRAALDASVGESAPRGAPPTEEPYLTQLLIRERGATLIVPVRELEWIEADSYYVRLHTGNGSRPRLLRERMSILEARLDPAQFLRTHRSAIVRTSSVRAIRPVTRYEHRIVLASGAEAPLSRERRPRLEALLATTAPRR